MQAIGQTGEQGGVFQISGHNFEIIPAADPPPQKKKKFIGIRARAFGYYKNSIDRPSLATFPRYPVFVAVLVV